MRGNAHVRFGGAGRGNELSKTTVSRPGPTLLFEGGPGHGKGLSDGADRGGYGGDQAPDWVAGRLSRECRELGRSAEGLPASGPESAGLLGGGDGALGLWAAVEQHGPASARQRCTDHRTMTLVDKLPKDE